MNLFKKTCCKYKSIKKIIFGLAVVLIVGSNFYAWYVAADTTARKSIKEETAVKDVAQKQNQIVRSVALDKERKDQIKRDISTQKSQPTAPKAASSDTNNNISTDRFTQTEAFLSLPAMKNLIAKHYNIAAYGKVVDAIIARERQYKDNYYVFYHGTDNVWRLPQDLYTQLYVYFNPLELNPSKDFKFLRFEDVYAPAPKDFLTNELKKGGLINDHGTMGAILLSVNLSLFANVGYPTECTWEYFVQSRGHLNPDRSIYEKIMNIFGLTHKYIPELMSLVKLYETKEETIVQIFVPKDKVDEIGYLAWVKGIPADEDTINWVESHVADKTFSKRQFAIEELETVFHREKEHNPIFRNLLRRAEQGDFSLDSFLKIYRNHPEDIKNINIMSARLIFTPDVLLNPNAGVKFFRYSTAKPDQLERYHKRLNEVVNKILSEKTR